MPNLAALLLLSAGALESGPAVPLSDDLKCGRREGAYPGMPEFIVMVDNEVVAHSLEGFDQREYDISHLEMICWQWAEKLGIQVRSTVLFLLTPQWEEKTARDRLENLEALISEQERYLAERGVYAGRVEQLTGYNPPRLFEVHMRRTADGWAARTQVARDWAQFVGNDVEDTICYAFAGSPPPEWDPTHPPKGVEFVEREAVCFQPRQSA